MSRPITAGPAEARRSTIIGSYDIGTLETAQGYVRGLYHRTVRHGGKAAFSLQARDIARAGTPPEQAAPLIPETTLQSPRETRALQARSRPETFAEQAPSAPKNAAEAHPPQARQAKQRQPVRLAQADAKQRLRAAGLTWSSSGKCANRRNQHCTSLEAVRAATVSDVIELKRRSCCPLVVTGGTEVGHAPGPYSHYAGYKLDIKPNACINRYITKNHPSQGVRGDGAPLYGESATSGTLYARETDHWDILFR
ncbi:hypothetical protein OG884_16100 [Streptosporangium sp. NBC_01755]|uniref:hypothetical protein n=1 Tax=unclassified Streptosporangium TaxID=2632669 RepID=UPI002DDBF5E9|nr:MULTISPECIES: hypothetical protein [unclassified Streptosporangium]WSA25328.1 hypothetical protein OIE13_31130 [Streptosporangium sp. NBC_01810]WSD03355.1 hypothetical protein OG884_16100 [Streptosporangium sp. NBC_01755]